jgi:hypothetical protein
MNTRCGPLRCQPLLAPPAQLGGAGLLVDEQGHTGHLAQAALHGIEFVACMEGRATRELGLLPTIARNIVGHHDHLTRAPSASTWRAISATPIWPSTGWPPVIATASL